MNASQITFMLFLASLVLLFWKPEVTAAKALHVVLWGIMGFLCCLALLFALFTVWWPPTQTWSIVWCLAALAALASAAVSRTKAIV